MKKNKHMKNFESVTRRISVLRFEIQERQEELQHLAQALQDFEFSASVDLRSLKDDLGIKPVPMI
ncbi:hypothetical protein [Actinomycetia phage DSL-LC01]|nr:hypothetical protein [Actinomycetia phage DSL-LC01]